MTSHDHARREARTSMLRPPVFLGLLLLAIVAFSIWKGRDIHWGGFAALIVSYAAVGYVGFLAAGIKGTSFEDMVVADRSMPLWLGIFTMAATWIDGGYINGSAEYAYSQGLVWVQAPWCYALSLVVGGFVYAPIMRRLQCLTMLDVMEQRYGARLTGCLYVVSLTGDVFWSAAILTALGTTFATIMGLDFHTSVIISAALSVSYTIAGGMWSVAFTNVLQLILIVVGLFTVVIVALPQVGGLRQVIDTYTAGMGDRASLLPPIDGWRDPAWGNRYWDWWERTFVLILGGIPWQGYFQRVLSARNERTATWLSVGAAGVCLLVAVPSVLIGLIGYAVDWSRIGAAPPNASMILPYTLRYLTTPTIAALGLGAVAAAVMSSVASSVLASGSMAAWNIYRPLIRPGADDRQLQKAVKTSVILVGTAATMTALNVQSVYALWYLCADFVYCILLPQLTTALFFRRANRYGAIAGFVVSFTLRLGGGDPTLGLPALIPYPMVEQGVSMFPFRTLAMLSGLTTIVVVSLLTAKACPPQPLRARALSGTAPAHDPA